MLEKSLTIVHNFIKLRSCGPEVEGCDSGTLWDSTLQLFMLPWQRWNISLWVLDSSSFMFLIVSVLFTCLDLRWSKINSKKLRKACITSLLWNIYYISLHFSWVISDCIRVFTVTLPTMFNIQSNPLTETFLCPVKFPSGCVKKTKQTRKPIV